MSSEPSMSILLFVNLKGGVAKTTNAVAVAECLADSGYRTLLIDADHQCMSGELLLGESRLLKCERQEDDPPRHAGGDARRRVPVRPVPDYVVPNASDIGGGLAQPLGHPLLVPHRRLLDQHGQGPAGPQVERRVPGLLPQPPGGPPAGGCMRTTTSRSSIARRASPSR